MSSVPLLKDKLVLVVDDDADLREALAFDLKRKGCVVYLAASGKEAIEIVRVHLIDIVISDVRMPDGDGIELLKAIRAINDKIPIVMLATGFADLSEPEALNMGAYALVDKPIDRKRMMALLTSVAEELKKISCV